MSRTVIIGIDPGETTGMAILDTRGQRPSWAFLQTDEASVLEMLGLIVRGLGVAPDELTLAMEEFVVGNRPTGRGGAITRQLIQEITDWAYNLLARINGLALYDDITVVKRRAADVKPWATDRRLTAAGIAPRLGSVRMRDAHSAAQHALFHAVKTGVLPDPFSRGGAA